MDTRLRTAGERGWAARDGCPRQAQPWCCMDDLSGGGNRSMRFRLSLLSTVLVIGAVGAYFVLATGSAVGTQSPLVENNVLAKALNIELGTATRQKWEQLPSSGLMYPVLQAAGVLDGRASGTPT